MKHRTQILPSICLVFASTCCAQSTTDPASVDPRLYGVIPDQSVAQLPTVAVHGTSTHDLNTTISAHTTVPTIPVQPGELNTRVTGLARAFERPVASGGVTVRFIRTPLFMPTHVGVVSLTRAQLQTQATIPATTTPQEPSVRALAVPPGPTQITTASRGRLGNAAARAIFGLVQEPVPMDLSAMPNTSTSSSKTDHKLGLRPGGGGLRVDFEAKF